MSSKKKPAGTPLHLLQQLSISMLEEFEKTCSAALDQADKGLNRLHEQRTKAQEDLLKARASLEAATTAGKDKALAKARETVAALEKTVGKFADRQAQFGQYVTGLKRDAQESMNLAQGIGKVREAVEKALLGRQAKPAATAAAKPAAKPVAKPAASPTAAKPAPRKPAAKPAPKAVASTAKATPATATPARKPAARKPAA